MENDILDILLDEENRDTIVLADAGGRELEFEQVAVIPYSGKIYCVLKPITKIEGIGDDEAVVFRIDETEQGDHLICAENDEGIAITIFEKYYDLLEENEKE